MARRATDCYCCEGRNHSVLRRFSRARTVREYGYSDGRLIEQASASGFLLPWEAIDAEAQATTHSEPNQYLVTGEYVADDGRRTPELAINPAWLRAHGYERGPRGWGRTS